MYSDEPRHQENEAAVHGLCCGPKVETAPSPEEKHMADEAEAPRPPFNLPCD